MRIILSANQGNTMSVIGGVTKALGTGGLAGGLVAVGAAAGAAAIGLGVASVKAAGDFQNAMNQNVAHAGLAKDQIQNVTKALLDMGPAVGQGPTQLAQALYPILSGFSGITNQAAKTQVSLVELKDAAQAVVGTTTSVTTVSNAATGAFNALGLGTNNVQTNIQRMNTLFDQMNTTVSSGNMQWSDYAKITGKLATSITGTTVKWTEANAALATLTNESYSTRQAQTYLANLFTQLDIKTDSLAKNANKLGISFDEQKFKSMSLSGQLEYLRQITGGNSSELLKLMNNNSTALKTYNALSSGLGAYKSNLDAISHSQGASAKAFADASAGWNVAVQRLKAMGQAALISIGNVMLPILTKAVNFIMSTVVPQLQHFAGILWNMIKPALDSVGKALGQINWQGVAKQVGQIAMNVTPAGNAFQSLSEHTKDLGKWFTSSVLPAIRGAEPGFKNLGSALLGLLPLIQNTASVMRGTFKQAFDAFLPVFERIIPMIIQFSGVLANGLGNAIRFLTPYVMQAVKAVGQFAGEVATRVAPIIQNWLTNLQKSIQFFQAVWNVIWPGISNVLQGVWQEIVGVVKIAWSIVSGLIKVGLDLMSGNWKQAWTDVQDMFKGIWDGIVTYFKGAWQIIQGTVQTMVDGIKGLFTHLWDALVGHSIVPDMINGIVSWFGQLPSRVGQALNTLVAAAGAIFSNLAGMAVSWGANIIQGVVNGITSMIGSVTGAISNIAGIIADHLPHSPAKRGPLTQLNVFGKHLVETFAKDISSNSPKARAAAEAMASNVVKALQANKLQLAAADLAGDRNKVKALESQRRQYELILKDYKDLVTLHHDTWNAKNLSDPIAFASTAAKAKLTRGSTLTSFEKTVTSDLAQIISLLGGTATSTVNTGSIASGGGHIAVPGSSSALHWIPEQRPIVITHHHTYQIHTMARNPAEVRTLVDMIEHEQSRRFRTQTSGYSAGGVF